MKGKVINTISALAIRKGLVIFQFTISIILILGATLIQQQMNYLSNQNLGFNKAQKIILPIQTNEALANIGVLKNELIHNSMVRSAAEGGSYPGVETVTSMLFYADGKSVQENVEVRTTFVEPDYIKTLDLHLLEGRGFAKEFIDDERAFVLNEAAVKHFGYTPENAIGKKIHYEFQNTTRTMNIIGVVKDYHFESLHQKIRPLALTIAPFFSGPNRYLILNVHTTRNYPELIGAVEKIWKKINPDSPFDYSFLDADFQRNYEKEERASRLIQYFTIIAIAIACLGLFGLSTFTAEQRTKEIGVRKVLGASVVQIVRHLSKDLMGLVFLSIMLSAPIAYYAMSKWLQNFAYHVAIEWWVFVLSGCVALIIALLTISFQSIKAALANPVDSLRSE